MSILNRPSDGLFNFVVVLYRILLHEGAMSRDKLLALTAPPSVNDEQTLARVSLNTWIELGLFNEDADKTIRTSPTLSTPRRKDEAEKDLPVTMRSLILAPHNNERFWEAADSRGADFTRAVSWMLAQDVYQTHFVGHKDPEKIERDQILDQSKRLFQNDTRWPGFKAWAPFLGFGSAGRYPKNDVFVIDPTIAMRERLDVVFNKRKELDISEFIDRFAEELPVLDRGVYRLKVESQLNPNHWVAPEPHQVSTSLSRALIRLHEAGLIWLDSRSDSSVRLELLGTGHRCIREVTHIMRKGTGA